MSVGATVSVSRVVPVFGTPSGIVIVMGPRPSQAPLPGSRPTHSHCLGLLNICHLYRLYPPTHSPASINIQACIHPPTHPHTNQPTFLVSYNYMMTWPPHCKIREEPIQPKIGTSQSIKYPRLIQIKLHWVSSFNLYLYFGTEMTGGVLMRF